jgi:hypothetical protein
MISIKSSNDSKLQFPKLMRNGVHTVLFASPTEGMVVEVLGRDAPFNVGSIQNNISSSDYHDYSGTVKISNGK